MLKTDLLGKKNEKENVSSIKPKQASEREIVERLRKSITRSQIFKSPDSSKNEKKEEEEDIIESKVEIEFTSKVNTKKLLVATDLTDDSGSTKYKSIDIDDYDVDVLEIGSRNKYNHIVISEDPIDVDDEGDNDLFFVKIKNYK